MNFLVVDDEVLIRKSLIRAFAAKGHTCDEAQNGIEALLMLEKNNYDAVLLDVIMPEKNGYEVLLECKKNFKFFIISAFSGDDTNIGFIQNDSRVIEYISKPFEHINLIIEQVLKHL